MKIQDLLVALFSVVVFSAAMYNDDRYPPGKRLPSHILRPQRKPMPGYDCESEFYPQLQTEETLKHACPKVKKKSWFSRILRKYPKKYVPQPEEKFDVSGDFYIYPLLRKNVYKSRFSRYKGDTFLVLTSECEIAGVIKKDKCNTNECKKNPEYKRCELLSLVPAYPKI